jgi:hypothetical protein
MGPPGGALGRGHLRVPVGLGLGDRAADHFGEVPHRQASWPTARAPARRQTARSWPDHSSPRSGSSRACLTPPMALSIALNACQAAWSARWRASDCWSAVASRSTSVP